MAKIEIQHNIITLAAALAGPTGSLKPEDKQVLTDFFKGKDRKGFDVVYDATSSTNDSKAINILANYSGDELGNPNLKASQDSLKAAVAKTAPVQTPSKPGEVVSAATIITTLAPELSKPASEAPTPSPARPATPAPMVTTTSAPEAPKPAIVAPTSVPVATIQTSTPKEDPVGKFRSAIYSGNAEELDQILSERKYDKVTDSFEYKDSTGATQTFHPLTFATLSNSKETAIHLVATGAYPDAARANINNNPHLEESSKTTYLSNLDKYTALTKATITGADVLNLQLAMQNVDKTNIAKIFDKGQYDPSIDTLNYKTPEGIKYFHPAAEALYNNLFADDQAVKSSSSQVYAYLTDVKKSNPDAAQRYAAENAAQLQVAAANQAATSNSPETATDNQSQPVVDPEATPAPLAPSETHEAEQVEPAATTAAASPAPQPPAASVAPVATAVPVTSTPAPSAPAPSEPAANQTPAAKHTHTYAKHATKRTVAAPTTEEASKSELSIGRGATGNLTAEVKQLADKVVFGKTHHHLSQGNVLSGNDEKLMLKSGFQEEVQSDHYARFDVQKAKDLIAKETFHKTIHRDVAEVSAHANNDEAKKRPLASRAVDSIKHLFGGTLGKHDASESYAATNVGNAPQANSTNRTHL